MLNGGYSWRLYFYVILAFAIALFILTFFIVEESSYDRKAALAAEAESSDTQNSHQEKAGVDLNENAIDPARESIPPRKTYLQTLSPLGRLDRNVPVFKTMIRSFSYFLVPQALWVITTYGIYIGLGAFVISFTFPILIVQPPYLWDLVSTDMKHSSTNSF